MSRRGMTLTVLATGLAQAVGEDGDVMCDGSTPGSLAFTPSISAWLREIADELDDTARAAEVYRAERDHAKACLDRAVKILTGIHVLLYPPLTTDGAGRTWAFKSPMMHEQVQALSDRIRAIPDEIAAIDPPANKSA